jgi:PKD repeat protein
MVVAGKPIDFTDTSTGMVSVSWDFGDGTPPATGSPVSHTYEAAGTYTVTDTITSSTGETKTCSQDIVVTAPTTGTLDVSSVPNGAEIFINGQDQVKATPAIIQNIPVGDHELKLTLAGFDDYITTFTISGGETTTLSPILTPSMVCSFSYSQP